MNEENINNPFKNGDTAVCVCEQAHKIGLLTLGKEYEVLNADEHFVTVKDDEGQLERYNHERFVFKSNKKVVMEQTAERIREDILHIEKRIEEAKKDIASMKEEKNVLLQKLKDKGFEMIGQKPSSTTLEVGDRVVITGYSKGHHNCDYTGYEGTLKRIDDSYRPYEVYLYHTGRTHWFTKDECEKI